MTIKINDDKIQYARDDKNIMQVYY